jgi:hypothetical protein
MESFPLLIGFFILLMIASSVYAMVEFLSRCPQMTIWDVRKILRQVDAGMLLDLLLESHIDDLNSLGLSRRSRLELKRKSLYEAREYLLRMSHNAFVLAIWAQAEYWQETHTMPPLRDRAEFIELSRRMHAAAIQFRIYALMTLVRMKFWMVFRMHWWWPFHEPTLVELRDVAGVSFYSSYHRLKDAVGALCRAYGDEFYEQIMAMI